MRVELPNAIGAYKMPFHMTRATDRFNVVVFVVVTVAIDMMSNQHIRPFLVAVHARRSLLPTTRRTRAVMRWSNLWTATPDALGFFLTKSSAEIQAVFGRFEITGLHQESASAIRTSNSHTSFPTRHGSAGM